MRNWELNKTVSARKRPPDSAADISAYLIRRQFGRPLIRKSWQQNDCQLSLGGADGGEVTRSVTVASRSQASNSRRGGNNWKKCNDRRCRRRHGSYGNIPRYAGWLSGRLISERWPKHSTRRTIDLACFLRSDRLNSRSRSGSPEKANRDERVHSG